MINEDFVSDLIVIDEVLTKSLKSPKLFNFDENIEIILSSMIQIIRELKINNHIEKFVFESSELVEELINDNELLKMNEFLIVKTKDRSKKAKNKKEIMTRVEKAKAKFIKRDSFDFKHVKINFRRDDRDEQNSKEIKKFFVTNIATIMKTNI